MVVHGDWAQRKSKQMTSNHRYPKKISTKSQYEMVNKNTEVINTKVNKYKSLINTLF